MGKKSKNKTQLSEQNPSVNGRGGKKSDLPPTPPPDVESEKSLRTTEELPDKPKAVTDGRSATERGKKKNTKSKKPKKSKGIVSKLLGQITLKRFFFAYVFYVVLVCSDITPSELESSPTTQFICTNGISRYILKNDLFKKYIEPSITVAKVTIEEQVQPMYETHGKPLYAAVEPHLQTAYSYYVEYVKIPTTLLWRDVKKLYNDNAKEHVDKYYGQLSHAIGPYAAQGKEQVTIAYNAGVSKYKTVILPWYKKEVSPVLAKGWDKSTDIYYTTVKPTATDGWEKTKQFYNEVTIPAYYEHVHPLIIAAIDFIKEKYEVLFEDPAERKAKEEEERRAKEEAERKIREEAERQAKAKKDAERKAAERKAKEEAERKAKEEAERKARKEAERKAKQEANAALDNAAKSELTRYEDTVSESIFEFKVGIDDLAKARADEIATEISNLQSFADSQISSIKTRADELLADSTKNVTDKTYALGAAIKEIIDSLKTKSKEIKRKSKEAIENARSEISIKRETAELNLENQLSEANFNLDTIVKKHPKADSNRLSQARVQISADVVQGKKSIGIFTDEVLSSIVDTKTQEITTIATDALERIKIARALSDQAFQQQHEELVKLQFEAELAKQVEATVKDKQDVVDESVDATIKKADGAGNVKIVDEADDDEAVFEKLMAGYREYKANIEEEEDDEDEEESCDVEGTC